MPSGDQSVFGSLTCQLLSRFASTSVPFWVFFFRSRKHGLELNHCVKFQHFPPTSPYIVKRKPDPCQPRWEDGSSASLANHFAATIWGSFQKIRPVCTICRETKCWRAETFVSAMHLKGHYGRLHITEGAKNTHSTEDLDNRETSGCRLPGQSEMIRRLAYIYVCFSA